MKLLNKDIGKVIKFLDNLHLKGRESLGRTKLKEKLTEKNEAITKDQIAIIDEFDGWADKEQREFTTANKELNEAVNDLLTQEAEITYNSPFRKDFTKALEEYDGELSGADADAYALLYEELITEKENE